MKAIHIKDYQFDPKKDLDKLNSDLKDCTEIVWSKELGNSAGHILICKNYTRKDKLEKISEISNAATNNNSI